MKAGPAVPTFQGECEGVGLAGTGPPPPPEWAGTAVEPGSCPTT